MKRFKSAFFLSASLHFEHVWDCLFKDQQSFFNYVPIVLWLRLRMFFTWKFDSNLEAIEGGGRELRSGGVKSGTGVAL